jgi:hypothetical protein
VTSVLPPADPLGDPGALVLAWHWVGGGLVARGAAPAVGGVFADGNPDPKPPISDPDEDDGPGYDDDEDEDDEDDDEEDEEPPLQL